MDRAFWNLDGVSVTREMRKSYIEREEYDMFDGRPVPSDWHQSPPGKGRRAMKRRKAAREAAEILRAQMEAAWFLQAAPKVVLDL